MFYNHILLEAYCTVNELKKCKLHNEHISIECFSTHCKFLSYTEAPNEIALVDKNGVAMHFIGFGGDVVYIGSDLPKEYSGSKYTNSIKGTNAKAKANAATGIPEMIEMCVI